MSMPHMSLHVAAGPYSTMGLGWEMDELSALAGNIRYFTLRFPSYPYASSYRFVPSLKRLVW